jgi:predicted dienelactone hydrolase
MGFKFANLIALFSVIVLFISVKPSEAAEIVNLRFLAFEVSIPVDDLEAFSKTGELRGALNRVSGFISPSGMENFRRILTNKADIPAGVLSRFLYTFQGEKTLDILGEVIKIAPDLSGNRAIRAAAILAADDKQNGLSLINLLRKFPTSDIYLDIQVGLQTIGELSNLLQNTQKVVKLINNEAATSISQNSAQTSTQLADLRERGSSKWEQYSLTAPSLNNQYEIPFYLLIPQRSNSNSSTIPAIIIYPGLSSSREPFLYLAEHLASYGFAVVLPISPTSSAEQLYKLSVGAASEIAPPQSFVDRPNDITAILNFLEQSPKVNNPNSSNISWKNVGIIGHSFGGYAALALISDAKIQFTDLAEICQGKYQWNASLLLQCVALGLPKQAYKLGDPRITAAIAVNPVTSYVLGKPAFSKITVPIAIVGSSNDTVAPSVPEQIVPFTWLTSANRYLLLLNSSGHTAVTSSTSADRLPSELGEVLGGANPIASQNYLKLLSVAFFKTHLVKETSYTNYLTTEYFAKISAPSAQASLLRTLSIERIEAAER